MNKKQSYLNLLWFVPVMILISLGMWLLNPKRIIKRLSTLSDERPFDFLVIYYATLILTIIGLVTLFNL